MTNISDHNWRIKFWNKWEEWENDHRDNLLRVFQNAVLYMRWAEQPNSELDHWTPWKFAQQFGANSLMDYLYYLANRDYWTKVSAEYLARKYSLR